MCLGLGIAALGTEDEEAFEDVKNVLYMDNAGGCPAAPAAKLIAMAYHHICTFTTGHADLLPACPHGPMRQFGARPDIIPALSGLPCVQWRARRQGSAWACCMRAAAPRRRQSCWRTHTRRRWVGAAWGRGVLGAVCLLVAGGCCGHWPMVGDGSQPHSAAPLPSPPHLLLFCPCCSYGAAMAVGIACAGTGGRRGLRA